MVGVGGGVGVVSVVVDDVDGVGVAVCVVCVDDGGGVRVGGVVRYVVITSVDASGCCCGCGCLCG